MKQKNRRWLWFQQLTKLEAWTMEENRICLRCEHKIKPNHDYKFKLFAIILMDKDGSVKDTIMIVREKNQQ